MPKKSSRSVENKEETVVPVFKKSRVVGMYKENKEPVCIGEYIRWHGLRRERESGMS